MNVSECDRLQHDINFKVKCTIHYFMWIQQKSVPWLFRAVLHVRRNHSIKVYWLVLQPTTAQDRSNIKAISTY